MVQNDAVTRRRKPGNSGLDSFKNQVHQRNALFLTIIVDAGLCQPIRSRMSVLPAVNGRKRDAKDICKFLLAQPCRCANSFHKFFQLLTPNITLIPKTLYITIYILSISILFSKVNRTIYTFQAQLEVESAGWGSIVRVRTVSASTFERLMLPSGFRTISPSSAEASAMR